jgi:arylsulfatase A-like enzyme
MRTVFFVMDSLNRAALECYGEARVRTPNFSRLAKKAAVFDQHRVGSLPCMPARRDLHTGRLNFLHRSWGPLEPFDESVAELLSRSGVYTHLVTDHFHYWEDGGATYHNRFDSYELIRGQEGDRWRAWPVSRVAKENAKYHLVQNNNSPRDKYYHNKPNRAAREKLGITTGEECIALALEFLRDFAQEKDWFLQIECFDPHEPFDVPARYREGLATAYRGPTLDWPPYARVRQRPEEIEELRASYFASIKYCDDMLGRLLDHFDAQGLWGDVNLILTTDHGYLLGEHNWWAKNKMPIYEEIAHIPLFIWAPERPWLCASRVEELTQTIDLMPTILELHDIPVPSTSLGRSLVRQPGAAQPPHRAVLYGMYGGSVNICDGEWTYYRYPVHMTAMALYQYTLMPCHMNQMFSISELQDVELYSGFSFTKGVPVLKARTSDKAPFHMRHGPGIQEDCRTALFNISQDPKQDHPVDDPKVESRMMRLLIGLLVKNEAPDELYARLGISAERDAYLSELPETQVISGVS